MAALMASFSGPKAQYDPSDISTLFQDSAGTTPVVAAGDGIGRILDKSGAGNHATQTTTPSRPLWQTTYAAFDGTDDSWATPNIDFTSTDKVTVIAGVRKESDALTALFAELSATTNSNNGAFYLAAPASSGSPNFGFQGKGTIAATSVATGFAQPVIAVVSGQLDIAAASTVLRVNGAQVANTVSSLGTGNLGNYPLYVGRRAGSALPFTGRMYGLIIIGRLLSPDEMWVCERYMAQQAGIVLP